MKNIKYECMYCGNDTFIVFDDEELNIDYLVCTGCGEKNYK